MLWFLSSDWWWFSVFFSDLINPLVQASFELIADVSVTVSICPRSYGQLTSHCPRDFSSLPPLSIMQKRVLEDQAMLRRACPSLQRTEQGFLCAQNLDRACRSSRKV